MHPTQKTARSGFVNPTQEKRRIGRNFLRIIPTYTSELQ
jgi:hypothetical protein